jgi:hypothetical protein
MTGPTLIMVGRAFAGVLAASKDAALAKYANEYANECARA